jgi:hypothetical protein
VRRTSPTSYERRGEGGRRAANPDAPADDLQPILGEKPNGGGVQLVLDAKDPRRDRGGIVVGSTATAPEDDGPWSTSSSTKCTVPAIRTPPDGPGACRPLKAGSSAGWMLMTRRGRRRAGHP